MVGRDIVVGGGLLVKDDGLVVIFTLLAIGGNLVMGRRKVTLGRRLETPQSLVPVLLVPVQAFLIPDTPDELCFRLSLLGQPVDPIDGFLSQLLFARHFGGGVVLLLVRSRA